jgi:hypothetical protein
MIDHKVFSWSKLLKSKDCLEFLTMFLTEFGDRVKKRSNNKHQYTNCNQKLINELIEWYIEHCPMEYDLLTACIHCVPYFTIASSLDVLVKHHTTNPIAFFKLMEKILKMNPDKIDAVSTTMSTCMKMNESDLNQISPYFHTLFHTLAQFRRMDDFFGWYGTCVGTFEDSPLLSNTAFRTALFDACCLILPNLALQMLRDSVDKLTVITPVSTLLIITLLNSMKVNTHLYVELNEIATQVLSKLNPFQYDWAYLSTYYAARRVCDVSRELTSSIYTLQESTPGVWLDCGTKIYPYKKGDYSYPIRSIIVLITIQRMIYISTQYHICKYNGLDGSRFEKEFHSLYSILDLDEMELAILHTFVFFQ